LRAAAEPENSQAMTKEELRRGLEPVTRRLMHFYWRFSRALTLGVRGVVIDGLGRVFLVRHSYVAGWHLPGGGVEPGETLLAALSRELEEEGNISLSERPVLHGMFYNSRVSRRDHVAVFVVRAFRQEAPPQPNHEIVEHGFFALDALPPDTSLGTRRRIAEVFHGAAISERW
jgi:8-oxo-dGTP pyrophosphatase MutT (NUDIX family)